MLKKGFTLAEILITLAIIGVIASLAVPALIQEIQDSQFKTAWKNTYGILEQAARKSLFDNGGSFKGSCTSSDDDPGNDCLRDKFLPYLNYIKKCNSPTSNGNCWHNNSDWKYLNGNTGSGLGGASGIILNNGTLIWFWLASKDCNDSDYNCGSIAVDVNGFKGPNVAGKDLYNLRVNPNSIQPAGAIGFGTEHCTNADGGWGCSSLYLHQ